MGHPHVIPLFYWSLLLDEVVLLVGTYALGTLIFKNRISAIFVSFALTGTVFWVYQGWFNFSFYYSLPLCMYLGWKGIRNKDLSLIILSFGVLGFTSLIGSFAYSSIVLAPLLSIFLTGCYWVEGKSWRKTDLRINQKSLLAILFSLAASLIPLYFFLHEWSFGFGTAGRAANGYSDYFSFLNHDIDVELNTFAGLINGLRSNLETSVFGGILMIPLVLVGLLVAPSRKHVPFIACAVFVFLFWMGAGSFLAPLLFLIPGFALMRSIGELTPLVKVMLVFLAGLGFDAVVSSCLSKNRAEQRRPLVYLLAALVGFSLLFLFEWKKSYPSDGRTVFVFLCYLAATIVVAIPVINQGKMRTALASLLLVISFLDVMTYRSCLYHQYLRVVPSSTWEMFALRPLNPVAKRSNKYLDNPDFAKLSQILYTPDVAKKAVEVCGANGKECKSFRYTMMGTVYGNLEPFTNMDACKTVARSDVQTADTLAIRRVLGITADLVESETPAASRALADYLHNDGQGVVTGCEHSKFQVFDGVSVADPKQLAENLRSPSFTGAPMMASPAAYEQYMADGGLAPSNSSSRMLTGLKGFAETNVNVVELSSNHVSVEFTPQADAKDPWLYYSDSWHSNWKALVNGVEAPILRANIAFKAVRVPAGKTARVEFVFPSEGYLWPIGLIYLLSAVFAVGIIYTAVRLIRGREVGV